MPDRIRRIHEHRIEPQLRMQALAEKCVKAPLVVADGAQGQTDVIGGGCHELAGPFPERLGG